MTKSINSIKHLRALAAIVLALAAAHPGLASMLTVLHSFNGTDGNTPMDGLVWRTNGNFYGTTRMGGAYSEGTIYSISPAAAFASVYQFQTDPGGYTPFAKLASFKGQFIGTSFAGGSGSAGAAYLVYQSGPSSWGLGNWYEFTGGADGGYPEGALIQGSDGNFYGTTAAGGTNGNGIVFQLNPITFALSNLYTFSGGADGSHPVGALVQGSDGSFYGMAEYGGTNHFGTVFSIGFVTIGSFHFWSLTTLHIFTGGADGGFPNGGLVQGTDGYFYGVTHYGSTNAAPTVAGGGGTVYKINSAGGLTLLHSFGDDYPQPLMQATDGNFYGTTGGGSNVEPNGTIFQITPSGALTTLWTFNGTNGSNPSGALVQYNSSAAAGYLIGTASAGGSNGLGTVFSLPVPLSLTNAMSSGMKWGPSGFIAHVLSSAGATLQLQSLDSVGQTNWANAGSPIQSGGGLLQLTDPGAAAQNQRFYRVQTILPAIQ